MLSAKIKKLKTPSSKRWLQRQMHDPFVRKAIKDGFRARSAYKLIEIDERFCLINSNTRVLELGSSPGSWSQVISKKKPRLALAIDLLPMKPVDGVKFLRGDFCDEVVVSTIGERGYDLVLSDVAPNACGHRSTDTMRAALLCKEVVQLSRTALVRGGSLVMKCFQCADLEALALDVAKDFESVKRFKPKASRSDSNEIYLVCLGHMYKQAEDRKADCRLGIH